MTRKKRDFTRPLLPDPKFGEQVITRAINIVMRSGKRGIAETAIYSALDVLEAKTGEKAITVFHRALDNIKPVVEVRSRRVGGATYQVPTEVRPRRAEALALRWVAAAAADRGEKTIGEKLAAELMDALSNRGAAMKKKEDTHRMAEANKAFAHFKW